MMANRIAENFSRAAAGYEANAPLQRQWRARVIAQALACFPPQAQLLDMGCGTGAFAREVTAQRPHWQIANLDLAYGMCAQATRAVCADAAALPIADEALDGLVSSLCLQWVEQKAKAFTEIARVLKPGAHAVLMTLGAQTLQELHATGLRQLAMLSVAQYNSIAHAAGLEILQCEDTVETHRYDTLSALLHSFKAIGARAVGGRGATLTPSAFATMERAYAANHAHPQGGVVASWQPLLLVLRKGEAA